MVGFFKRCASIMCCVLIMMFCLLIIWLMSVGDISRPRVLKNEQQKTENVTEKFVWVKAGDQRISPSAAHTVVENSVGQPPRPDTEVRLNDEKEAYLQQLASRQGQVFADEYRAVLTEYEADKNVYDIVLFGDSLTYRGDWSGLSERMSVANRGINGDMIDGLEHRIDQIVPMQPRALFLLVGINDLSVRMRPEVYEAYGRLLDRLMLELPDTEIYVQSILPVRDDLRRIMSNDVIALVNGQIKQMCDARGLCYIDVYTEMLNPEERRLYYNYQLDGLHLSEQGYDVWGQVIKPYVSGVEWQSAVERAELEKSRRLAFKSPETEAIHDIKNQ